MVQSATPSDNLFTSTPQFHSAKHSLDKETTMRITTRRFATIVILLTSLLLSPVTLVAQATTSDWSRLNSVVTGSKLSVKHETETKSTAR